MFLETEGYESEEEDELGEGEEVTNIDDNNAVIIIHTFLIHSSIMFCYTHLLASSK